MQTAKQTPEEIISQGRANNVQSAKRLLEIIRLERVNDDLADALKECLDFIAEGYSNKAQFNVDWAKARAAIAKAEGK